MANSKLNKIMKKKIYFITLLIIGSLISSCEKDDLDYENDFEKSKKAWLNFKKETNNSYKYQEINQHFNGVTIRKTITVSNGIITKRNYKLSLDSVIITEWTENENEIGLHELEAFTMDEIYDKAEQEWLIKRENAQSYFETDNNGLISTCGYVDTNCIDGCFTGITISFIEELIKS